MAKKRNPKGMGSYRDLHDGRVAWRQTVDGETRELSAMTMAELKAKVKEIADLPIVKEKYTVAEWFDKWLKVYIKPLKKEATYNQYYFLYNSHIKPVLGKKKITSIKSYDVQSVIAKMNTSIRQEEEKDNEGNIIKHKKIGYSSKTMKETKGVMNRAFTKALKDKIIPTNPVVDIEIPVKQKKIQKTLTIDELAKIFKEMKNSRWIWSVKFALVTGLRRGELLALKWTDIDYLNRRIVIEASNSSTGVGDTKSSKVHHVPLPDKAIEYLDCQKEMLEREVNPIRHNKELEKTQLIFPNIHGKMLNPSSYYSLVADYAARAGIKASPHCLRHTFVYMTKNKLTLKELQAALGHDESTTTLDIYGDMLNASNIEVASRIDDAFSKLDDEVKKITEKKEAKVIDLFARKKAK